MVINTVWEDYYKILQVHFLAEPEMINNAYRKLSKKYHPDVNKVNHSEQKMKAIIRAYEVLGDPKRRQQYFMKWVEKNSRIHSEQKKNTTAYYHDQVEIEQVKSVLLDYLNFISVKDYNSAFDMLSERDQRYIAKQDFIKWQLLVSEVFELINYDCEVQDIYKGLSMGDSTYEKVADIEVKVIEKNHLMGRKEKDELSKSIVFENNTWNVFLGRKDLTSIIAKFNELANMKKRHRIYTFKTKRTPFVEEIPGIMSKRAFVEKAKLEQKRYSRYKNPFSLIVCEIHDTKEDGVLSTQLVKYANATASKYDREMYRQIGIVIAGTLRELDFICRWKETGFIILLPETKGASAIKAADKIKHEIEGMFACSEEFTNQFTLRFRIAEQVYGTFKELYQSLLQ